MRKMFSREPGSPDCGRRGNREGACGRPDQTMPVNQIYLVDTSNEALYRSLRTALSNDPDVEVFYDRPAERRVLPAWPGLTRWTA